MSRRNDGTVVFVVESGAAEINQAHIRPLDSSVIPFLLDKKAIKFSRYKLNLTEDSCANEPFSDCTKCQSPSRQIGCSLV